MLGVVVTVSAEYQRLPSTPTQQVPTPQVRGQGAERLSHFPTVMPTGPGSHSAHGAHPLFDPQHPWGRVGGSGVGLGAAPGESPLALPASVHRSAAFWRDFSTGVTCTLGLPSLHQFTVWFCRLHSLFMIQLCALFSI